MKNKYVVYTTIFGSNDSLKNLDFDTNYSVDYICFTNNNKIVSKKWTIIHVDNSFFDYTHKLLSNRADLKDKENILMNRELKFLPYNYLKEYSFSVYIDAHIKIKKDLTDFIKTNSIKADWLSPQHRSGGNVLIEAYRCYESDKINKDQLFSFYSNDKHDFNVHDIPFSENGLILRNHDSEENKKFSKLWWNLFVDGIKRDQLYWQLAYKKQKLNFKYFPFTIVQKNDFFIKMNHKNDFIMMFVRKFKLILRVFLKK